MHVEMSVFCSVYTFLFLTPNENWRVVFTKNWLQVTNKFGKDAREEFGAAPQGAVFLCFFGHFPSWRAISLSRMDPYVTYRKTHHARLHGDLPPQLPQLLLAAGTWHWFRDQLDHLYDRMSGMAKYYSNTFQITDLLLCLTFVLFCKTYPIWIFD